MKPFFVFSTLTVGSAFASVLAMFLVLGLFEDRLGTPVILEPGQTPVAYDTDVMPITPCCGSLFYLIAVNALYPGMLGSIPAFGRRWWIITSVVLAAPLTVPALLILSALFANT